LVRIVASVIQPRSPWLKRQIIPGHCTTGKDPLEGKVHSAENELLEGAVFMEQWNTGFPQMCPNFLSPWKEHCSATKTCCLCFGTEHPSSRWRTRDTHKMAA
jgi:hypothetical protein